MAQYTRPCAKCGFGEAVHIAPFASGDHEFVPAVDCATCGLPVMEFGRKHGPQDPHCLEYVAGEKRLAELRRADGVEASSPRPEPERKLLVKLSMHQVRRLVEQLGKLSVASLEDRIVYDLFASLRAALYHDDIHTLSFEE